jgi:hypothetical protein
VNPDFLEMLRALSDADADYLVVGAHAMAVYGHVRATGDLDIWVRPERENAERVWDALLEFGAPVDRLSEEDLCEPDVVFQVGRAPNRIDVLTSITGIDFDEAWPGRRHITLDDTRVPVIGIQELIRNKRAAGRLQDRADAEVLERLAAEG